MQVSKCASIYNLNTRLRATILGTLCVSLRRSDQSFYDFDFGLSSPSIPSSNTLRSSGKNLGLHPRAKFLTLITADYILLLDLPLNEKVCSRGDEVVDNAGGTSRVAKQSDLISVTAKSI